MQGNLQVGYLFSILSQKSNNQMYPCLAWTNGQLIERTNEIFVGLNFIIICQLNLQTFKQSLLNIMKNISHSEFSVVISVLDELMKQRRLNFLLKAWTRIKMQNKKNRILFSNPSFAGKLSQLDQLDQESSAHYARPRHNTMGNQRSVEQENISFNKNDFSFSTTSKNSQFQDMVLERLKLLQTKLCYLQQKKKSKKGVYQEIKKKSYANLQKYNVSRHSLSSKQNVDTNSLIKQTKLYRVVDEASEKSSNDEINFVQTPKIGGGAHQKQRKSFIFPQVYDALNLNNQTQGTQNMEEVSLDKNELKNQSYFEYTNQCFSDRFHVKNKKNQYQPNKGYNTFRNKNKKSDYMKDENNLKSPSMHPSIPYSKKKESSQKWLNYRKNKMLI